MQQSLIVYLLTALALIAVVLTRVRLVGVRSSAGRQRTSPLLLNVHSVAGLVAVATWTAFLISGAEDGTGNSVVGVVALGFFWLTTVAGIMILFRWLPAKGRHASASAGDSWSRGPGLSLLAHVGMLVGVCYFTYAYANSAV